MAPDIIFDETRTISVNGNNPPRVKTQVIPIWKEIASRKQLEREVAIAAWEIPSASIPVLSSTNVKDWPLHSGRLSPREIEITETVPTQLQQRLSTGEWAAEETLRAFIQRTIIAHHLVNPLTEVFFERGIERAKELDRYLKANGRTVGPFHGLPISLKDIMNVQDIETTQGFVAWVGNKPGTSDTIVDLLYEGGAVFYCKTNVPQTLMSGECFNYVFGRTTSPWNTTTSAGGSSGGEGALVALGGSSIGVGSDIGGSVNTPANFNGIYGLCPSHGRFPLHGPLNTKSNLIIEAVSGPLCRSIDGLEVFVRGVLELSPWEKDPFCLKMPWNQIEYEQSLGLERKLCFAFIANDGIVTPHPPIQRGIRETKAALERAGHYIIETPSFFDTVSDGFEPAILKIFNACGRREIQDILNKYKEPLSTEIVLPSEDDTLTVPEYIAAAKYLTELRQKYLKRWKQTAELSPTGLPVDAFILPSGGHVAPPHGTMEYLLYEAISNMLDWTCATIPVTHVHPALDSGNADVAFTPLSDADKSNHQKCKLSSPRAESVSEIHLIHYNGSG